MRATTLFCLSMALFLTGNAQQRFISADYTRYYDWFHEHAQTAILYTPNTSIYIFEYNTPLRQEACLDSKILTHLSIGQTVKNLSSLEEDLLEDQINGYDDRWYPVQTTTASGQTITGFIWGAFIAKGWRYYDIAQDGQPALIMLGVSSHQRASPDQIQAEIRVLQGSQLLAQEQVPGLCVFEECASSVLIRVIPKQTALNIPVIEASTLTVGCELSIEKNYFFWNGLRLQRVMHGELVFEPYQQIATFVVEKKEVGEGMIEIKECRYIGEDDNFNPIWDCKTESQAKEKLMASPSRIRAK